jgi:UDP-3-O-acyl N-acetylglucosamine deacetylase
MSQQHTLKQTIKLEGVGIHSGIQTTLILEPAPENHGLIFYRDEQPIPVQPSSLFHTNRATILKNSEGATVKTPEHLLSALYGMGVDNAAIHLSEDEVPILDGSALSFVEAIQEAGIIEQQEKRLYWAPESPIWINEQGAEVLILPSPTPKWTYILEYPNHFIGTQIAEFFEEIGDYATDIAPARTYGFFQEVEALRARGLALGGSLDNALVIGDDDYLNPVRFDNELARHKLLDMIGDFCVLGRRVRAHVIGIRSGHFHNMVAVKKCLTHPALPGTPPKEEIGKASG